MGLQLVYRLSLGGAKPPPPPLRGPGLLDEALFLDEKPSFFNLFFLVHFLSQNCCIAKLAVAVKRHSKGTHCSMLMVRGCAGFLGSPLFVY